MNRYKIKTNEPVEFLAKDDIEAMQKAFRLQNDHEDKQFRKYSETTGFPNYLNILYRIEDGAEVKVND